MRLTAAISSMVFIFALLTGCAAQGPSQNEEGNNSVAASQNDSSEATSTSESESTKSNSENSVEYSNETQEEANEKDVAKEAKQVKQEKDYTTSNGLVFSLFKITTSPKLQTLSGAGSYYEAENGCNYIDVILEMTNNSSQEYSLEDAFTGFFIGTNDSRYDDMLVVTEVAEDDLDRRGSIRPQATLKAHIGYMVPNTVTSGKACFVDGEDAFYVEYDADKEVTSKKAISLNEVVKVDKLASFELLSTTFTSDLLPPDTSGVYTHYEVDDPSNYTYLVAYCNLSNDSNSAIKSDGTLSMRAVFDKQFEYTSFMVLEETDGKGFDYASITSINPLETRKAVFLFEVPKKVETMPFELIIYFYGNEYSYVP